MPRDKTASSDDHATDRPPVRRHDRDESDAILGLWILTSPDLDKIGSCLINDHVTQQQVGRGRTAHFRLHDDWLSRLHFEVGGNSDAKAPASCTLRDLGTSNGTHVNGIRRAHAVLQPGDVVRAGATLFAYDWAMVPQDDVGLIGWSRELQHVRSLALKLAGSDMPVVITGETGVGKEIIARAIHQRSDRKGQFLAINMASLVPGLVGSQLFGHRRGAFSGAVTEQAGAFDVAHGGTLLLDEIGDMLPEIQASLLRVVQFGQSHRLGDPTPHDIDVRLITATLRDLQESVGSGGFREDLYWRIAQGTIDIPPLRGRRIDIVPIFNHLLATTNTRWHRVLIENNPAYNFEMAAAMEKLYLHSWPGNVRELEAEAKRFSQGVEDITARQPKSEIYDLCSFFDFDNEHLDPDRAWPTAQTQSSVPDAAYPKHLSVLEDADALEREIESQFEGNIRAFSRHFASLTGMKSDTVRRRVYRKLKARQQIER